MTTVTYPLTLLYDAQCPVCALEMDHLRSRNDAGRLRFVDISAAGLGWVLLPTGWTPLKPAFDWGYRVFARHRRRISGAAAPLIDAIRAQRARRTAAAMRACASGACRAGDPIDEQAGRTS